MLRNLLGWAFIISGIFFLIKPAVIRNLFARKSARKVRRWLFPITFVIGILLLKAGWGVEGWVGKFIVILGIISLVKLATFINKKAYDKITEWAMSLPVWYFRISAVIYIIIGSIFLLK